MEIVGFILRECAFEILLLVLMLAVFAGVLLDAKERRWRAGKARRVIVSIWAAVVVGTWTLGQFGRSEDAPRNLFLLLLMGSFLVVAPLAAFFTVVESTWRAGLRSFAESIAALVLTVAAMVGIHVTCHTLGLGNWPPRDAVFVQRFRDQRAVWLAVRDLALREAKASGSNMSRRIEEWLDPRQDLVRRFESEPFRELGVAETHAACDGRWLRVVLWEGRIHHTPIDEKGLLFVDPDLAGAPEARLVERLAVEDLGDGWYVYEDT